MDYRTAGYEAGKRAGFRETVSEVARLDMDALAVVENPVTEPEVRIYCAAFRQGLRQGLDNAREAGLV